MMMIMMMMMCLIVLCCVVTGAHLLGSRELSDGGEAVLPVRRILL